METSGRRWWLFKLLLFFAAALSGSLKPGRLMSGAREIKIFAGLVPSEDLVLLVEKEGATDASPVADGLSRSAYHCRTMFAFTKRATSLIFTAME